MAAGEFETELYPGDFAGQGRYELIRHLGSGGMGVVWLARDHRLEQDVALKYVSAQVTSNSAAFKRLKEEVVANHALSHPNIARIHDLVEAPMERPFMVMEYVDGYSLQDLKRKQSGHYLRWRQVQPILRQLCDALRYAHGEGVMHRDLKPGNLMLDQHERLKLVDFGIVGSDPDLGSLEDCRLQDEAFMSYRMPYLSPQQLGGEPAGILDDIYALGVTLYELLTGRPPFHSGDLAHQIQSVDPPTLEEQLWEMELENDIPKDIASMVMACLSKDPRKRPRSAEAVAAWIGLDIDSPPTFDPDTSPNESSEFQQGIAPPADHAVPPGNGKRIGLMVLTGLLGVALVAIVWKTLLEPAPGADPPPSSPPAQPPQQAGSPTEEPPPARPGALDPTFQPGSGANDYVKNLALAEDGRIYLCGAFTRFDGEARQSLARLNHDGTLDPAFTPPSLQHSPDPFTPVFALALDRHERVLFGGRFHKINGAPSDNIARLMPDGTVDETFSPNPGFHNVHNIVIQPDSRILAAGNCARPFRKLMLRLSPQGTVDPLFQIHPIRRPQQASVYDVRLLPDGTIVAAGSFSDLAGRSVGRIVRLQPDGKTDPSFNPGSGANNQIEASEPLPRGKLLIGGHFTRFNGRHANHLTRLNPDGSLDAAFIGRGTDGPVHALCLQPDGRIIIGGAFTQVDGVPRRNLARIHPNGRIDRAFDPGTGPDDTVEVLTLQPDGRLLVGGKFTQYNDRTGNRIARIITQP